ncbi:cytochrome P450 2 Le.CYP2 [Lentinula aciculospora]|uniref:Cytochrome P450 2 Le.CYP2 n=1 Tax=Lentinula aciculospora TaxID=153920 RepID=A0A9W9DUE9_9AGAR|nr:cytochrome P450 2 Le.CYP2 [Lentinula aciculospora]
MAHAFSTSFGTAIAVAVLAVLAVLHYLKLRQNHNTASLYPPGPPVREFPTRDTWIKFQEWGKFYGELVYIREMNLLIVNDFRIANDLLEKRARIFSDRLVTPMMELCGSGYIFSIARYSNEWRRDKKLFLQNFRQATINRFYPYQYGKIHEFLRKLSATPDNFMRHTMILSQSLIFSSLYGLDVDPEDRLYHISVDAVNTLADAISLGNFPAIERFPWLRYMPSWFPGCGFKKVAARCLEKLQTMDTVPFNMAMENLRNGSSSSIMAELAVQNEGNPEAIEAIKRMGLVSYIASADTTMSAISSFLLSMTLHPDAQKKGQEEIDLVIGQDRLPTFEDRQSLPYVEAIYREVMRLHPALPTGVAHASIEDDFYRGYHIPKGCAVIPNIWAMNRDEEIYSEPDKFMPERHLDTPGGPFTNINNILAFGFGRRVCAGRYMADNTVWLTIASVLATFTLSKAKDGKGNEIDIPEEYTSHMFRHPKPYQSSITPRNQNAKELILATALSQ